MCTNAIYYIDFAAGINLSFSYSDHNDFQKQIWLILQNVKTSTFLYSVQVVNDEIEANFLQTSSSMAM